MVELPIVEKRSAPLRFCTSRYSLVPHEVIVASPIDQFKNDLEGNESNCPELASVAPVDINIKPVITVPAGDAPSSLVIEDLVVGEGAEATPGVQVNVDYVGVSWSTGAEFDASWNRGDVFAFGLGAGMVIPGWDQGVAGMKVGGRRQLTIPPEMAYGPAGAGRDIGPNETLIFVVDLRSIG